MNHIQLLLLLFLSGAAFISGTAIYIYSGSHRSSIASNRSIYLGETLLLGSAVIYGLFMLLGIAHLYMKEFLLGAVALNYLWLFSNQVRTELRRFLSCACPRSVTFYVLIFFIGFFTFRNYFFMVDVDSHSSYLHAQKLWLTYKTSIVASDGVDIRIFTPHFEDVIGALGMSVYPNEALFSQLINIFFRLIAILLVYGYTTYRFNSLYGLAACLFIMFNLHFYVSGANRWVLMNGALIAVIFAVVYNFFESYQKSDRNRFFIALLFLTLFPSNKYQSLYVFIAAIVLGFWIQPSLWSTLKSLFKDRNKMIVLVIFVFIALLHFIKNWIATGWPFFPMFSSYFNIFNRDPEMDYVFGQLIRGASLSQFFKYVGFLFIWHGMKPAHWIFTAFCFLPVIFLGMLLKKNINIEKIKEFAYWMAMSFLGMAGICLINHTDPRQYVYVIGVLAFSTIFLFDFVLVHFLQIKKYFLTIAQIFILFAAVKGANILITPIGGMFDLPTMKDNIGVLTNKLHTSDVIGRYYPMTAIVNRAFELHPDIMAKSAYAYHFTPAQYSLFLVPPRPSIALYMTSMVKWKSYENQELIVQDIKKHDIQFILDFKDQEIVMKTPEEFAEYAVKINRYPEQTLQEYGFPIELKYTDYSKIKNK